jgi:hypothetical protein
MDNHSWTTSHGSPFMDTIHGPSFMQHLSWTIIHGSLVMDHHSLTTIFKDHYLCTTIH